MPFCVQRRSDLIEILPDDIAEMPAAGMQHDAAVSVFVLLQFDEVVSAAERSRLKIAFLQLRKQCRIRFILLHFLLGAVKHRGCLRLTVMPEAGRHIPQDIPADRLHEIPAAGDGLPQHRYRDISLDKAHAAADVHTDCIRNHGILTSDDTADRHTLSGVGIGHQRDPLERERQL